MNVQQIQKIIESCHLNFLIGSGASKDFLETLGEIENLQTELGRQPHSDQRDLIEASILKYYFDIAIRGNINLIDNNESFEPSTKKEQFNLTNSAYSDFLQSLETIINKRKSNLVSKQVNIFTTNMDLFLEKNLEELHFEYNDGFYGKIYPKFGTENFHNVIKKTSTYYEYQSEIPLFNIFKLHGSVNWQLIDDTIIYDKSFRVLRDICEMKISKDKLYEIEYNDGGITKTLTIDELFLGEKSFEKEHRDFLKVFKNLVMINPTKEKFETTTRDLTFYELLRLYSNHLERENSILFVIGFSFADEHIREITKRVALSNPTLQILIFAFDEKAKTAISQHIPERNNIEIISPNSDDEKLSLHNINQKYFKRIANDLQSLGKEEIHNN